MTKIFLRNLAVAYGVYIASWWVAIPLALAYGKLTKGIHYYGDVGGKVLLPLSLTIPYALVAFGVGACVVGWWIHHIRFGGFYFRLCSTRISAPSVITRTDHHCCSTAWRKYSAQPSWWWPVSAAG